MHAIVLNGGPSPHPAAAQALRADTALIIAADSGLHSATELGLAVDAVVGDMDSVLPEALRDARVAGTEIVRYPPEKDATDLALALSLVRQRGATAVTVVSGVGYDRFDHLLAAVELLGSPQWFDIRIDAFFGAARLHILHHRDELTVAGQPGDLVSLIPLHGCAEGITLHGFRYPLHDAVLEPGSTLGVSNELTGSAGRVTLLAGTLVVIQPTALKEF